MYYDADDTTSMVNELACIAASHIPDFETYKVPPPKDGKYRGACILCYCPMLVNGTATASEAAKFSAKQMADHLMFWTTQDAIDMYKEHDTPYHRLFGAGGVNGAPAGFTPEMMANMMGAMGPERCLHTFYP